MSRNLGAGDISETSKGAFPGGLWSVFAPLVAAEGCELFDLEIPPRRGGVLRVFITRPAAVRAGNSSPAHSHSLGGESQRVGGVTIDDCSAVSRRITRLLENEPGSSDGDSLRASLGISAEILRDLAASDWTLEVSSPGINRRLSRTEHFIGAVGERIKLRAASGALVCVEAAPVREGAEAQKPRREVRGTLCEVGSDFVVVRDEESKVNFRCAFSALESAHVDFAFDAASGSKRHHKGKKHRRS